MSLLETHLRRTLGRPAAKPPRERYERASTGRGNAVACRKAGVCLAALLLVAVLCLLIYLPLFFATLPLSPYEEADVG
jgi:hypothetical protein